MLLNDRKKLFEIISHFVYNYKKFVKFISKNPIKCLFGGVIRYLLDETYTL